MKQIIRYTGVLFLILFFNALWIPRLSGLSIRSRITPDTPESAEFRRQYIDSETAEVLTDLNSPGSYLAVYWLESRFGEKACNLTPENTVSYRKQWEKADGWGNYLSACQAVWDDLIYFPVACSDSGIDVSFENSWMYERSYREERNHEGTDIMPDKNQRGVLPVVSMTDGIVESKGWLELGGYRIGIRAPHGAYFYYAHLDSYADIEIGSKIKAGDLLGFMGDTGYGKEEGTRGKFPVHLHVGIYISNHQNEISINPYSALKYTEDKRLDFQSF